MPDIEDVRSYLAQEHGLAVVSTTQADGRVLSSVVNCGVIDHPTTGDPCVALVARGDAARLTHIRRCSQVTIAIRRGWTWLSVTGPADLIGPDDLPNGIDAEGLRLLLREVFQAAGGTHDDYDEYDRVMADDARVAVLVAPERILGIMSASA
jgi:PPOX class probable F420-dependent enzyme